MFVRHDDQRIKFIDEMIAEKQAELEKLHHAAQLIPITEADLQALNRIRRMATGELSDASDSAQPQTNGASRIDRLSKPGSISNIALHILRESGKPMHVDEVASRLHSRGLDVKKPTVIGTLVRYTKSGFLNRTAPNTFSIPT